MFLPVHFHGQADGGAAEQGNIAQIGVKKLVVRRRMSGGNLSAPIAVHESRPQFLHRQMAWALACIMLHKTVSKRVTS